MNLNFSSHLRLSALVLAAYYVVNFLFLGFLIGPFDYDHLSGYYDLAYRFWVTQGASLPGYNPFLCGGRTLGGDPQIPIFHPLTLLVPLLGPTVLIKWEMLAQLAFGSWALVRVLQRYGVSADAKVWALILFLGGGGVVARFLVGHVTLGFYFLFPAFFYYGYRLCEAIDFRRPLLAYWALFIYSGLYKPNFIVYAVPALGCEVVVRSLLTRNLRPVLAFAAGVLLTCLVNADQYLPAWKYFSDFPRTDGSAPHFVPWHTLLANLLLPLKAIPKAWYGTGFFQRHEYNVFLGPVALAFAAVALKNLRAIHRSDKRAELWALVAFGVFSAVLGTATDQDQLSLFVPYTWLREIWPGFRSIRVPTRFWFGTFYALIIFSARGFRAPRRTATAVLFFLFAVLPILGSAGVNLFKTTVQARTHQFVPKRLFPDDIVTVTGAPNHEDSYGWLRQGIGVLDCVDNVQVYYAPVLTPGRVLKPILAPPHFTVAPKLAWENWSTFRVDADAPGPFELGLNLNHADYWTARGEGVRVISRRGDPLLLASAGGPLHATLEYRQPFVREGVALTILGLVGYLVFLALGRRNKMVVVGLTGGVGAGKSAAARQLAERGIKVIDLDDVGRKLLDEDPDIARELRSMFGEEIFSGGKPDRKKMRAIVFESALKRQRLEELLHPRIWTEFVRLAKEARAKLVVCEAALLVEGGLATKFDELVVVTAPAEVRRRRLTERDGVSTELADKMMAAQASDEERSRYATVNLTNEGTLTELAEKVDQLVARWRKKNFIS